jgi:transcriptional regulator with XRE-family HTH domain
MGEGKVIDYKAIGKRIRKARENKHISQGGLGKILKTPVTATAISLYESGERFVGLDVLADIAKKLEISMETLIEGYKEAPPIRVALRADKDLKNNTKAQDQILEFIDFVKSKTKK